MRTQGQDRFTGQANWKAGRVGSATELALDACAKERAVNEVNVNQPKKGASQWKSFLTQLVSANSSTKVLCVQPQPPNSWSSGRRAVSKIAKLSTIRPSLSNPKQHKDGEDDLDRGIIPNSQNKPKYGLMQIFEIALMCEVCLVIGFFIGRWLTHAH